MNGIDCAFLDSGTGGLPYMQQLKKTNPQIRCVYVGDTKNFPYGEKSVRQVIDCSIEAAAHIINTFNPKIIVIACNTISVTALEELRTIFSVPFVGTVPAIKLAATVTHNKRIGLLATKRTVNDSYTDNLIEQFAADCVVSKRGDSELISYIEHHLFTATNEQMNAACKPAVDFFLSKQVDTIVLGCTHFIHAAKNIAFLAGKNVQVIDSRQGVVKQTVNLFAQIQQTNQQKKEPHPDLQIPDQALFVTGIHNPAYEDEYKKWCVLAQIPFMGVLKSK